MSVVHTRVKTLDNLSEVCSRSFTQELRTASSGLPSRIRNKIRTELLKTEQQAKLSNSKLLMAKERKLQLEHLEEKKRKELENELLSRQQKSQKNLEKMRLSQRSTFETTNKKMDEVRTKLKNKARDEMVLTLSQFNKTQEEMISFYTSKEKKRREHNTYLQSIHKNSVSSEPEGIRTKRLTPQKSIVIEPPSKDVKIKLNSVIRSVKAGSYKPALSRMSIVKKLEKQKDDKVLEAFIGKMEEINQIRNKKMSRILKTPPKPTRVFPQIATKMQGVKNPEESPNSRSNHRYRFSEQYQKKLEQKKSYLEWSFEKRLSNGQEFLKAQSKISEQNKVNKIINQSKNQMRRRIHYSLMQQLKNAQ